MTRTRALIEAAERAQLLLRGLTIKEVMERGIDAINAAGLNPYCINEGRATGSERISTDWLDLAISSARAAEEGVERRWHVEWYSRIAKGWFPDMYTYSDEGEPRKRLKELTDDGNMLRLIRKDTYTTVISVREKEGL